MLVPIANPDGLVVSVDDAKKRLRVDHDDDNDDIEAMIRAATSRFQHRTGRVLLPTEYEFRLTGWNDSQVAVNPVRQIDDALVTYVDANGSDGELDAALWALRSCGRSWRLAFKSGLPALGDAEYPVILRLSAGYDDPEALGDDPALLPDPRDRQAVLMLVGHWYLNRSSASEKELTSVPAGFDDLVAERRIYR